MNDRDDMPSGGGGGPPVRTGLPSWATEPFKAVLVALLTAGGLVTFVAAVGGAVLWIRFYGAQLPADQAMAALPRGTLIASGAVMLAAFVVLGGLATVAVYIFDQNSLARDGRRLVVSLIPLVLVESLIAVAFASDGRWGLAALAGTVVLVAGYGVWALSRKMEKRRGDVSRWLIAATIGVLALAAVAPALLLQEWWLGVSLAAAFMLGVAVWAVATTATADKLVWCAIATFVSVPMLGAVVGITRSIDDPQVQPVALIRADDRQGQALQGIYITETDDRVYLATLDSLGCTDRVRARSGRLFWVPRDEVVAMTVGPPQSVSDAGVEALRMHVELAAASSGPSEGAGSGKRRLEYLGRAIEPESKVVTEIVPATGGVGDEIVLEGEDFGDAPEGRIVLVGRQAAPLVSWSDSAIVFKVPEALAGFHNVTIACGGLLPAPPVLRVPDRTPDSGESPRDAGGQPLPRG